MAKTSKTSAKSATKVTRITANDDASKRPTASSSEASKKGKGRSETNKKSVKRSSTSTESRKKGSKVGYFRGAWRELRQVRWPDRATTWKMTGAVLIFTAIFAVIILLLDAGFKYMFQIIIGR